MGCQIGNWGDRKRTCQVVGCLSQPVGVAPPTGEPHAGQPVARARRAWVAALGARPLWGWEGLRRVRDLSARDPGELGLEGSS